MLISPTIKVMLKILQGRLPQYVNQEFPHVQSGLREGRETRDQIASIHWMVEKERESQKNIYFCFIDYTKAFHCVKSKSLSCVLLFVTPWAIQFSRPEYWSGYPFPSPEDLPNPGIILRSLALQADSLPAEPQGKLWWSGICSVKL